MRDPRRVFPAREELTRLVCGAQRGEPGALDALMATLRLSFVKFFTRGGISRDDAEDSAQAALLRVAGVLGQIDSERATPFLITVARNALRSLQHYAARDEERFGPGELAEALESPVTPDSDLEYRELVRALHRASLGTLAPELGEIVRDVILGRSRSEIAARQGVSPITVRTRLLRARARLRVALLPYSDALPGRERATDVDRVMSSPDRDGGAKR